MKRVGSNRFFLHLTIAMSLTVSASAAKDDALKSRNLVTTIEFDSAHLAEMGVRIGSWTTSERAVTQHPLSVCSGDAAAFDVVRGEMSFLTLDGRFDGIVSGNLIHEGGVELFVGDEPLSLNGFELRAGDTPRTFDLFTADGELVFVVDHFHYETDSARRLLQIFSADVRISEPLAKRLGESRLAGTAIGLLSVTATVDVADSPRAPGCSDWTGEIDVALLGINSIGETDRANGKVVMTPSASLKNVGTANVPWHAKFSGNNPPYNDDQHPYLVWSVFRVTGGAIHMLGESGVKQAYLTLNNNCDPGACTDGHILGMGCEDTYGQGTNRSNNSLGPREEIHPFNGRWAHCDWPGPNTPSHFDVDGDCVQDYSGGGEDAFSHGLAVNEADLMDPTAEYRFYAWYIVRDDVNIFNTMGHRKIDPQFGTSWTFNFLTSLTLGSPLDTWVSPGFPTPTQRNETLQTAEGHLQVAVRVTPLGGGNYRYAYAVFNHDFDRTLVSLTIPLSTAGVVSSTSFRDIDDDASNDWTVTVNPTSIVWSAPTPADAMEWGNMYNFEVETNVAPVDTTGTMGAGGSVGPGSFDIVTIGPGEVGVDLLRHSMADPLEPVSNHLPLDPVNDLYSQVTASPVPIVGDLILMTEPVIFYGIPAATTLYVTESGDDVLIGYEF